jgi:hypothetical protein
MNAVGDAATPFIVLFVIIAMAIPSDIGAEIPAHDPGDPGGARRAPGKGARR